MNDKSNSILCVIDGSYWLFYTIFGAMSEYLKKEPIEASTILKQPEETDQDNLPNIVLLSEKFRRILKKFVMKRLETIDWHLKGHFQDKIDLADSIDYIFALDDYVNNNFRKKIYPEYKLQRQLAKKAYSMYEIQKYVLNVLFEELEVEKKYNYHIIKIDGAEGDDIIATIFKNLSKDYMLNVLFASDKDFILLENVYQINLFGKKVECELANEKLTNKEYLLTKILLGDGSDNICHVIPGVGPKKAIKLVRNKEELKKKLLESQDYIKQYDINKKLISFDYIPKELNDVILEKVNLILYKEKPLNSEIDLKNFMMM